MASEPNSPDLVRAEQIDAVCDRFERDWIEGRRRSLEEILAESSAGSSRDLFRSLLGVELELRLQAGEKLASREYELRFPDCKQTIREVFLELKQGRNRETRSQAIRRSTISLGAGSDDTSVSNPTQAAPPAAMRRTTVGRFEILEELGSGAFGTVYKARDPKLDREVAIKAPNEAVLRSPDDRERFLREARAAANLNHPNICSVHEIVEEDGQDFIVMAYVDGRTLSSFVAAGKVLPRQAAACVRKLALALQDAHDRGIIHRDIKPSNIMVSRKGDPVLMDFGLARLHRPGDGQITHSGQIMGSPAYMSPEQARGVHEQIGAATDIYSLGVVLYELLCGRRPFSGTVTEVLGQILHVAAPAPSTVRPGVDPELEAICMKAMAKSSGDRFASMKEFAQALGQYLKGESALATSGGKAAAGPVDDGTEADLEQMFAELASQQKSITRRVIRQAAREGARAARPPWGAIAVVSALAALVACAGIWFFIRKDTVTVVVQIPIDTTDPALSFLLDNESIDAAELAKPIELTPGDHELVVNRDGQLFKRFRFAVGKADDEPVVVQDLTPGADAEPSAGSVDDRPVAQWVLERGGSIVTTDGFEFKSASDRLPEGPFRVATIFLGAGEKPSGTLIQDEDLERFASLTELRQLDLGSTGVKIRGPGVVHLTGLKKLEELHFYYCPLTNEGLSHIGRMTWLRSLRIDATNITDLGLVHLKNLTELRKLHMGWLPVSSGVIHLTGLTKMEEMWLYGTRVSDADLVHFASMKNLHSLVCNGGRVTGAGFAPLQSLKSLSLDESSVTDDGLRGIAELRNLESLFLQKTKISDAGIIHLHGMKSLRTLHLKETSVTSEGLLALKRALPQCRIVPRPAAAKPPTAAPSTSSAARRLQEDAARRLNLPLEVTNSIGMRLTFVPAGEFVMGSPESEKGRYENEGPQRRETIPDHFYLGTYEVTQAQYERVTGVNPGEVVGENLPAGWVRWSEAKDFCRLLSELPDERAAGRAYRLPLEKEWEYACRAGSDTAFHAGESLSTSQANFAGPGGRGRIVDVGSHAPNAWRLFDMHGNVPEWCEDLWENRSSKVIRGGGWNKPASKCRSAYRGGDFTMAYTPNVDLVGSRVVMVPHSGPLPDVDRLVTEWATSGDVGGTVTVTFAGPKEHVRPGDPLPDRAFSIMRLDLSARARVQDADLERLSQLRSLQDLNLRGTSVSDAGLKHLTAIHSLLQLNLQDTKVSQQGLDAVRQALPRCVLNAAE